MPKNKKGRAAAKAKSKANEARQQGGKARGFAQNFVAGSQVARDVLDEDGKLHHDLSCRHIDTKHSANAISTAVGNFRFQGFNLGKNPESARTPNSKYKDAQQRAPPLRHSKVAFVSAGNQTPIVSTEEQEQVQISVPQEQEDVEMADGPDEFQNDFDASGLQPPTHNNEQTTTEQVNITEQIYTTKQVTTTTMTDTEVDLSQGAMAQMSIESSADVTGLDTDTAPSDFDMPTQSDAQLFMIDTSGDPDIKLTKADGKRPAPAVRDPSPAPSTSSEEVVLFSGRNKAQPKSIEDPVEKKAPAQTEMLKETGASVVQEPTISKRLKPHELQALSDEAGRAEEAANIQKEKAVKDVTNLQRRSPDKDDLLGPLERQLKTSQIQARVRPTAFPAGPMDGSPPTVYMPKQNAPEEVPWGPAPFGKWWKGEGAPQNVVDLQNLQEPFVAPPLKSPQSAQPGPSNGAENIADLQAEWKNTLREKRANFGGKTQSRKGKNNRKRQNRQLARMGDSMSDGEAALADYAQNLAQQQDEDESLLTQIIASQNPALKIKDPISGDGGDEYDSDYITTAEDSDDDSDDSSQDVRTTQDFRDDLYWAHPEIRDRHIREMAEAQARGEDEYDYNSSDLEKQLAIEEQEDYEDADDLRRRRVERMDDEKIARMFAKQQELGISGDELVIEDGDYSSPVSDTDEHEGFGDVDEAREGLERLQALRADKKSAMKMPKKERQGFFKESREASKAANGGKKKKGKKDTDFAFPSATGLVDFLESEEYGGIEDLGGFDIMDFERPSLNPRKTTGRRGQVPQEVEDLSDEELQTKLHKQWANDKEKKKAIKAHRNEQRMHGLLGANGGPADLNVKYHSGMNQLQLLTELTQFLFDEGRTSCPLPPMEKFDRRAVHAAVAKIGLNSKSVGKGRGRFTVVYKTKKTLIDDQALDKAIRSTGALKGFMKNNTYTGKTKQNKFNNTGRTTRPKRGGGVGEAGQNREGAVVAQHARELGAENKGHKLMEKMGWTKGMGLGSQNEGRLAPIEAMIKTNKSGLGQGSSSSKGAGSGQPGAFGFMKGKSGMGGRPDSDWE